MESFIIKRFFNLEKSNVVFEVTVIYKKINKCQNLCNRKFNAFPLLVSKM